MLSLISLVYTLAFFWSIKGEELVIKPIVRPKSLSDDQYNAQMQQYWTPEKLGRAINLDMGRTPSIGGKTPVGRSATVSGPTVSFSGSAPVQNASRGRALSASGNQNYNVGRVFFTYNGIVYSCSGAIITSNSKDLIVTAASCVFNVNTKTWYTNNWVFVPGYNNNRAPYGLWSARYLMAATGWTVYGDLNYDVGFVALSTLSGWHIQDYLGSQGIGFNWPRSAFVYALGYPLNINNGQTLQQCSGYTQSSRYTTTSYYYNGQGLSCSMTGGSGGGPWLQGVNEASGTGYVTSVTSFIMNNIPSVINGPYFDSNIASVYNQAKSV